MENSIIDTGVISKKPRLSGIELLKIIGIISIVASHLVSSLQSGNSYILDQTYALNLQQATADLQTFVLILMRYGASLDVALGWGLFISELISSLVSSSTLQN